MQSRFSQGEKVHSYSNGQNLSQWDNNINTYDEGVTISEHNFDTHVRNCVD